MMDGITATIAMIIVIACAFVGYAIGKAEAAEECKNFGAFENGSVIYKCERVSK